MFNWTDEVVNGLLFIEKKRREKKSRSKKMYITFGELSSRFGMTDKVCGILGLNPYCLNEGLASKDDKVEISESNALKMGITIEEFNSRKK